MIEAITDQHTLEGRIPPLIAEELRAACTVGWDPAFVASDEGRNASDQVVFRRHDQAVKRIIPWISRHINLSETDLIDFGAGCGSSALAFSKFARRVFSFEIDDISSKAFMKRMSLFNVKNVQLEQCSPETIFEKAAEQIGDSTSVMLVAVVEHLLENEQVTYLKKFWERLAPGQILSIMETPNYLAYFDTHTFQRPFANYVPDKLFLNWAERQERHLRFRDVLLGNPAEILERRRRLGLGVTSEPFEQAFGVDLNEIVVGDGFDQEMLNWFPFSFDDKLLLSAFRHYDVQLPIGFAKNVLSFTFRKPINVKEANHTKKVNSSRRQGIFDHYAPFMLTSS